MSDEQADPDHRPRDWENYRKLTSEIVTAMMDLAPLQPGQFDYNDGDWTIVHGDCGSGADFMADDWAFGAMYEVEPHPADWPTCAATCRPGHRKVNRRGVEYCPSAGHRRNAEMVAAGADVCLAFIRNGSGGATGCATLAEKAGIPVRRFLA